MSKKKNGWRDSVVALPAHVSDGGITKRSSKRHPTCHCVRAKIERHAHCHIKIKDGASYVASGAVLLANPYDCSTFTLLHVAYLQ